MREDNLPIVDLNKYNTEGNQVDPGQLFCGKPDGEQVSDRRKYQKSGIRSYVGSKDSHYRNRDRSGTHLSEAALQGEDRETAPDR